MIFPLDLIFLKYCQIFLRVRFYLMGKMNCDVNTFLFLKLNSFPAMASFGNIKLTMHDLCYQHHYNRWQADSSNLF
jgi:hypothetical protein